MSMKHIIRPILSLFCLLLGMASPLSAQMNYQGRLTDVNGDPIAGAQATIRFSLHDAETGGAKVWGDFDTNADLLEGRFNVVLGPNDGTARSINDVFTKQLYLQITLFDDQEPPQPIVPALPRQQILNAPFALGAFNAKHAETADLATNATNAVHATTATAVGDGNGASAITLDGSKVGIGTPTPGAILEIAADSTTDAFRVRVDGIVKLSTDPNGGLAIGKFVFPPANGLHVEGASTLIGNVGIGTSPGAPQLLISKSVGADPSALQHELQLELNNPSLGSGKRSMALGVTDFGTGVIQVKEQGVGGGNLQAGGGYSSLHLQPVAGSVVIGSLGTTVPSEKLEVIGNVKLGSTGQYYAPAAEENLRLLRGNVAADGTSSGVGFSSSVSGAIYTITYTNPFATDDTPVVTANVISVSNGALPGIIHSSSNTGFQIRFGVENVTNARFVPFNFIVLGLR